MTMRYRKPLWRRIGRRSPLYFLVHLYRQTERGLEGWRRRTYRVWLSAGRPVPAPEQVKQLLVRQAGEDYGCRVLVETGTFEGDMLLANRHHFARLVSIELSEELWRRASRRLRRASNVTLLHGDSADLLPGVVADLCEPALFWLDAHYSKGITAPGSTETPIEAELRTILAAPAGGHVVLIDDAQDFGRGDYPSIDSIRKLIAPRELAVVDGIIRFRV
jgi:hypothetical protein